MLGLIGGEKRNDEENKFKLSSNSNKIVSSGIIRNVPRKKY